ncbi:MAG: hypothetical protein WD341_00945 [Tistlia sp.]|uniref:hypothetical protein n=1 Tax=Tistlia sp. TaxID=3057121 RepID=UPI0034A53644
MGAEGKEISISFKTTIVPSKDLPKNLREREGQAREGVFGVQELEIGGEHFVAVFGRTHVEF